MSALPVPLPPVSPVTHAPTAYLASLAHGSRETQAYACETLARLATGGRCGAADYPWMALRYHHVLAIRAALVAQYSPRTVNRHLVALRAILKQCWLLGQLSAEDYQRAILVKSVAVPDDMPGRALSAEELSRLWASLEQDTSLAGARDRALLRVLVYGGLRAAEPRQLRRNVALHAPLPIVGKGGKLRHVPLPRTTWRYVVAWLACSDAPPDSTLLFPDVGRVAIAEIVRRRMKAVGLGHVTPHDCRRTYLTLLLHRGADPLLVAKLAGHSDVNTTRLYDRRDLDVLAAAVDRYLGPEEA